jgi:signal transduction histidine kinase
MDVHDPADVTATRDLVLGEVDRMSRLVRELLLLAKSDRPDFLKLEPVQVADLTHDVLTLATALGVRDWQVDEVADVEVTADGQRLTQALLQLCENAVKHTRPGATIALGSRQDDGQLRLWVRDTGPGVPPDQREQVFHRFARADARSSEEGFGLGLSIVRAIAVAHGGTARIEDADPPGALVVLDLPVRRRGGVPPGDRAAADRTQEIPTPRPEETRWPTS